MILRIATNALALVLAVYALLGVYVRPEVDDLCNLAAVIEQGVWGATVQAYTGWTGRILYSTLVHGIAATQPWSSQVMPALLIGVSIAALRYAAAPFTRTPLLAALALTYALILGPNLWQVFYLPSAVLNYLPPLLAAAVLASYLYRRFSASSSVVSPRASL
jgi:hypothetical protein